MPPELISRVTDEAKELAGGWSGRPLERFYPAPSLDAPPVNVRDGSTAAKKSVCLALAMRLDGQRSLAKRSFARAVDRAKRGAAFWTGIMNELKTRGAAGIPLAAVDGLSGFPDAIAAALPKTEVQLRMARPVRDSARFVPYKDRKAVTAGLRKTRLSPPTESAAALGEFAEARGAKHPMISKSWRNRWAEVAPFFKFSPEIRKAVYTTNAIESVNNIVNYEFQICRQ